MAITSSPRLGITRWSAPADAFTRAQLDADHAALDNLVAVDVQGLLASRPAPGVRGRWYATTDSVKQLFREDGAAWREVPFLESPQTFAGLITANAGLSLPAGANIALATTTGTKIGTATTQKLGFFNANPIVQPNNLQDLGVVLSNLGLRAAGSTYSVVTSGVINATAGGTFQAADGVNFNLGVTTGTKFGGSNLQKLSLWGAMPVVQPTVTGSRAGNAALASLLAALAGFGAVVDNSTA